jgi:hypothetical protein
MSAPKPCDRPRMPSGYRQGMTVPKAGDRIKRWLLTDDSPVAQPLLGGRVEVWDPDIELEYAEERAAWNADPMGQFLHRFGVCYVDALLTGGGPDAGKQVSTVYELVACLPSENPDGQATWRLLMKIRSRTGPTSP